MTAATHYAFSYLITSAAGAPPETALSVSLFSLLPDIDHPESLIGRLFPGLSRWLFRDYGHRTITHSVFAVLCMVLMLSPLLLFTPPLLGGDGGGWYVFIVLAYASHIFIDLFNRSGVMILYPLSQKEYISFRTEQLRILVSSWKEYLLLFFIIILAFSITGRSFSISGAVRSVGKLFYKNYKSALEEYHENSGYQCLAKVIWYDHVSREKVTAELTVLNMFQSEIFLHDTRRASCDSSRLILPKNDIEEIEIIPTENKLNTLRYSGSDISKLSEIPVNAFVSGTVSINNFDPSIRSSEFIAVQKGIDSVQITLTSALPSELSFLTVLPYQVQTELEKLKNELPHNQERIILKRINVLKSRIARLNQQGFYAHYSEIMRYNKELQSLQSRLDSMRLNLGTDADIEVKKKIEQLKGYSLSFDVVWVKFY